MFSIYFLVWPAIAAATMVGMGLLVNKKVPIVRTIFMVVLMYIYSWAVLPPFAPDMAATWLTVFVMALIAAGLTLISQDSYEKNIFGFAAPAAVFVGFLAVAFFSSSIFNASRMANVIDVTDNGTKSTTVELVSQERARRVTTGLAYKKAAELIGSAEESGLASIVQFGTMYGNVTPEGEAVWMAPLEPTSFFRWWSNPTTPGYFIASHVNVNDSQLVEDKPISYGEGFYLGHNLDRHLYMNGYINYRYGDPFFQIDNEGNPHYVVPMMRPQVGIYSYFPEKWVMVDADSGYITEYDAAEDLPEWVDRAYPSDVMRDRLSDWGCYNSGFLACWFTGEDVIEPTPGMVITMDNENNMIYYTGTQFQNNRTDGATSGVSIINARTGAAEYYRRAGITEVAAMEIINGAVSNYAGWSASKPVLIQINGLETYFSVVTDASGARKGFGMVWQRNRDVYGVGATVEEALQGYLRLVRANRSVTALEGNTEIEEISYEGSIVSLRPVVSGGETSFYLRLDSVDDKVFMISSANPAEVATSTVGERVRVTTLNPEPAVISVTEFDNLMMELVESEGQISLNQQAEEVNRRNETETNRSNLEAQISDMDPEEVRAALRAVEE